MSRRRDAWLFALFGWDPTWQRRLPPRVRAAWIAAVILLGGTLAALAGIAAAHLPRERRWLPLAIMTVGVLVLHGVQIVLRREVLERLDAEEDERAAQRIQARLVPGTLPVLAGVELAAHYSPFRLIGGDYYDAVRTSDTRLLIAIADVAGKGTGAALLTANLQALLHFAVARGTSLVEAAEAINAHLVRHTEPGRFVTMVLAEIDLAARRLRYVNAGHNPPLGLLPGGGLLRLPGTGLPLGLVGAASYSSGEADLPAGSTLLFYTDGLSERANAAQELFGEERIVAALRAAGPRPARDVVAVVAREAQRFAAGALAEDDMALLLVRTA
jgi:serine phosphatase RsbU (regulator of sigma subunit)